MKSFVSHITSKHSFFWRYFSLLLILVVMFFFILSTSTNQTVRIHRDNYLSQTRKNFQYNAADFSSELALSMSLISSVEASEYHPLLVYSTEPASAAKFHYYQNKLYTVYARQCNLLNMLTNGFIYFRESSTCITKTSFYKNTSDCFERYFRYSALDASDPAPSIMDWIQSMTTKNALIPFPAYNVSIQGNSSYACLTILTQPSASNQVYGFLYATSSILDAFHLNTLPENTYFRLISSSEEDLFSYNLPTDNRDYIEFSAPVSSIASTAVIGIPESHFEEMTMDSQRSAQTLLLLSAFVGLALCFGFSYIGVKPLHSLIRTHALIQTDSRNEIDAIDNFIKSNKQTNESLQNMLLSSVLARTFYSLPIQKSEADLLTRNYPLFQESLRLAIVREQDPNPEPEVHNLVLDMLLQKMPATTICEHMSMSDICIIMPSRDVSFEMLQKILSEMNGQIKEKPQFVIGVSAPFTGIHNISVAVRQAQISIPSDDARVVGIFSETAGAPVQVSNMDLDLKELQQLFHSWNEEEVMKLLEKYTGVLITNPQIQPEELFYHILHLEREAAQNGELSFASFTGISYRRDLTPAANMLTLTDIARNLFAQKAKLQISEIQQLSKELVEFVKTHYSDPAFSLTTLAQAFCVSERFAHKAIITVTGYNFSKFLLNTRMEEAARMFRETDESISAVSRLCGCPANSTFYRNFKTYHQKTPAEYKEMFGAGSVRKD